jgi:hypothetical protein
MSREGRGFKPRLVHISILINVIYSEYKHLNLLILNGIQKSHRI